MSRFCCLLVSRKQPNTQHPCGNPLGRVCRALGRRVRNDIAADENVLGIKLSEDSKAAARWSLETAGEYYGVGAGTGISGFRANLGVGDDLFGSREDAYSETVRQKRWDWYQDDFSARLKPAQNAS